MFENYNEEGGFCVLDWVMRAKTDREFFMRLLFFFFAGIFICTACNIAWVCGIRTKSHD
jgi:hypothetical protein